MLPKTAEVGITFGGLHAQFVRCGKRNCRCYRGELHGPYHYLFWREAGRLRKVYVKRGDVAEVRAACDVAGQMRGSGTGQRASAEPDLIESVLETDRLIHQFLGLLKS